MEKHFTASVFIVKNQKVLLIYHRKLNKWLPPGGHLKPEETPPQAAIREALEETGLEITLINQENVWIERWNAKSFERPYLCLLEEVPAHRDQPAHYHMDLVYVGYPVGGVESANPQECGGLRWFDLKEINLLKQDVEIFIETTQVISNLLSDPFFINPQKVIGLEG